MPQRVNRLCEVYATCVLGEKIEFEIFRVAGSTAGDSLEASFWLRMTADYIRKPNPLYVVYRRVILRFADHILNPEVITMSF
jgi:hypothetical protein